MPKDRQRMLILCGLLAGWASWIRTSGMRESKSRALPLGYTPIWLVLKAKDRSGRSGPSALRAYGVGDGTRTRDTRNHNPMLYQLNYTHHIGWL